MDIKTDGKITSTGTIHPWLEEKPRGMATITSDYDPIKEVQGKETV